MDESDTLFQMPLLTNPLPLLRLCLAVGAMGQTPDVEFFEKSVRPVLVDKCQGCHGPTTEHSGLRVDSRAALLKGGARGPAIVPGQADGSLLLRAVQHEGLKMESARKPGV